MDCEAILQFPNPRHQILDTGLPLLYIIFLGVGSFSRHGGISVNILLIFTLNYPTYTRPSGAFTLSMSGKCHPESSRDNNTVDSVLEMYLLDVATCYIATVWVTSSPGSDTDRQIGGRGHQSGGDRGGAAEPGPLRPISIYKSSIMR